MQKKLMVAAVAGALAAPAAFAQTAVTIYGTMVPSFEAASANGGDTASTPVGNQSSARGAAPAGTGAPSAAGAYACAAGGTQCVAADLPGRTRTQSAGSNLGFRVREDLGGGMYANVQVELSIAPGGVAAPTAASLSYAPQFRNTAVGIGSNAWGEVKIGNWDTPFTTAQLLPAAHAGYTSPSANMIGQIIGGLSIYGPAAVSSQEISNFCNGGTVVGAAGVAAPSLVAPAATFTNTANGCLAAATVFTRRMPNTIQWWSPKWNGFDVQVMFGAETLRQANVNSAVNVTPTSLDPYLWSAKLGYSGGALNVGLGYERHHDFTAFAVRNFLGTQAAAGGATNPFMYLGGAGVTTAIITANNVTTGAGSQPGGISASVDDAWNLYANYTWGGLTLGAYWERLRYNNSYDSVIAGNLVSMQKNAWRLDGAYNTGPHTFGAQYARSGNISASLAGGNIYNGANTNANGWVFGYAYALSKRSGVFLYHTRITNDVNARYGGVVFGALAPANGGDPRYTGFGFRHTF